MSTRYWVGGDGNWSQANYHWSDTSGGTPNASFLPTSTDDVVFDANSNSGTSAFTVCVDETAAANCQDFSTSSLDGAMTLLMNSSSTLDCYGSMTLPASNFTWSGSGSNTLNFKATTTGKTLTTNGVTIGVTGISFNGFGGGWTLGSALTTTYNASAALNVVNGTFDTGNFNITLSVGGFLSSGTGTRSVNLGSSTITAANTTQAFQLAGTGLTFNAGTSTIICSAAAATFAGGGQTFNNVTFSGSAGTKNISGANTFNGQFLASNVGTSTFAFSAAQNFAGGALFQGNSATIAGVFTHTGTATFTSAAHGTKSIGNNVNFQNLTITCPAVDGITTLTCGSFAVAGTLTTTDGGSTARRVQIVSTVVGFQRTLTVGTNSLINTDFQDINAAGTASWSFGLGYGNLGGNTGITFDSSTLYWIGGTGNWSSTTNWSTSSGGSAANAVPGPQNSVIFDANSNTLLLAFTVTGNAAMQCNDFSTGGAGGALDGAMTLTLGATAALNVYGSMTLPASNFAFSNTTGSGLNFRANTTGKTFTTNGVSVLTVAIAFNGAGGEWTLGSALTSGNINVFEGSLVSGNYNITYGSLITSGSLTRSISLGSSTLTGSGSSPVSYTGSNLTWNAGTSTINCSNTNLTLAGNGLTFYNVSFTSTALLQALITGANTFNNLSYSARATSGIGTASFPASVTTTINGTLTFGSGTTGVARLNVGSSFIGGNATISAATLTAMSDVDFRNITATGASSPWSGTRIGDALGNSNITFTAARTVYWVSATSASWNGAVWNTTSGTAGGATANFPLAQDTIVIDDAGLTAGNTITVNTGWNIPNLSFSTRSTAVTFATGTTNPVFYGDLTYSSAVTLTGTGIITFYPQSKTATITSAGKTFTQPANLNMPLGTLRINGDLTLGSTLTTTLFAGTLDLTNNGAGNFTLSTGIFNANNSNTRSIAFGTGNITLTGNNIAVWNITTSTGFTYTGTPTVNSTYSGSTGTRTFNAGTTGIVESNALNFNVTAGSDLMTFAGDVRNLNFTGFSGTLANSSRVVYGNLTISSGMTVTGGTSTTTFAATSGTQQFTTNGKTIDNPIFQNGVGGTVQLQDNLTMGSTRTYTFSNGTLDLSSGNRTLTTGLFSSTTGTVRSIAFGTGEINVTGNNATVYIMTTLTGFTYTGTSKLNATYSGAIGVRYVFHGSSTGTGSSESNAININITAGTDIVDMVNTGNLYVRNLNFTGFTGLLSDIRYTIFGNLTFSSGMALAASTFATTFAGTSGTQLITTNGQTLDFPITQDGVGGTVQLQDNLTITNTSSTSYVLTNGALDLNNFNLSTAGRFSSDNSNVRSINFGTTGKVLLTGSAVTLFFMNTATNFSYTGTSYVGLTANSSTGIRSFGMGSIAGGTESNALSFYVTAGTDEVSFGSQAKALNLNFTGFSGSLGAASNTIYGNIVLSSAMNTGSGGTWTLAATAGTQQITTNGTTLNRTIEQNGVGGTVQLQDALTVGATYTLTVSNGTFDTNGQTISGPAEVTLATGTVGLKNAFTVPVTQTSGNVTLFANTSTTTYTLTAGTLNLNGFNLTASTQFSTNNSNVRSINFASFGKVILSGSGTVWDATTATNLTTAGSGMISLTSASAKTFAGGGASYRTISQDGVGTLTLSGANTFDTIDNTVQPTTVTFPAGATTSVSNFMLSGTSGNLVTINSNSPGTRFTLAQI